MKNVIPVLILTISLGCASRTTRVNNIMDSWLNHNIEEFVTQNGAPSSVFDLPSGGKVYSWFHQGNTRTLYLPAGNNVISSSRTPTCQQDMTTNNIGTIIAYRWKGNC